MAITGNKGEWSEFYAFLKLLSDQVLHSADEHLVLIPNVALHPNTKEFELSRMILRAEMQRMFHRNLEAWAKLCSD